MFYVLSKINFSDKYIIIFHEQREKAKVVEIYSEIMPAIKLDINTKLFTAI